MGCWTPIDKQTPIEHSHISTDSNYMLIEKNGSFTIPKFTNTQTSKCLSGDGSVSSNSISFCEKKNNYMALVKSQLPKSIFSESLKSGIREYHNMEYRNSNCTLPSDEDMQSNKDLLLSRSDINISKSDKFCSNEPLQTHNNTVYPFCMQQNCLYTCSNNSTKTRITSNRLISDNIASQNNDEYLKQTFYANSTIMQSHPISEHIINQEHSYNFFQNQKASLLRKYLPHSCYQNGETTKFCDTVFPQHLFQQTNYKTSDSLPMKQTCTYSPQVKRRRVLKMPDNACYKKDNYSNMYASGSNQLSGSIYSSSHCSNYLSDNYSSNLLTVNKPHSNLFSENISNKNIKQISISHKHYPNKHLSTKSLTYSSSEDSKVFNKALFRASKSRVSYGSEQKSSSLPDVPESLSMTQLLSRNSSECITTPFIEMPVNLFPPEPAFKYKFPCHDFDACYSLINDINPLRHTSKYGEKYFSHLFALRKPNDFLNYSFLMPYFSKFNNSSFNDSKKFFKEASNSAFDRIDCSPMSPIPSSPVSSPDTNINPLMVYYFQLYNPKNCLSVEDIPMNDHVFKSVNYLKSNKFVNNKCDGFQYKKPLANNVYREQKQTITSLKPTNLCIVCKFCAMQIFSFTKNIDPDNVENVFCSEMCRFQFNKSYLNTLSKVPQSVLFSDHIISQVPVFIHGTASKIPKLLCTTKVKRRQKTHDQRDFLLNMPTKRWQGSRWTSYSSLKVPCPSHDLKKNPNFWQQPISIHHGNPFTSKLVDSRICCLCKEVMDDDKYLAGRLLNYSLDQWVHVNCILWCYDTYETLDGCLMNSIDSMNKANSELCTHCGLLGAGLPCFHADCIFVYHLSCAYTIGCTFHEDRSMFCPLHKFQPGLKKPIISLEVSRRVYLSRDEHSLVADVVGTQPLSKTKFTPKLRIGSLILHSIGQLLPEHLESKNYHTQAFIYPVGFCTTRIYWSYRKPGYRSFYRCFIEDSRRAVVIKNEKWLHNNLFIAKSTDVSTFPIFVIIVHDSGLPEECFKSHNCNDIWQHILKMIKTKRHCARSTSVKLFPQHIYGEDQFGLSEPHIVRAIESLPGVEHFRNYVFKFGKMQLITKMPLILNPSGCARCEPKFGMYIRNQNCEPHLESSNRNLNNYTSSRLVNQIPRSGFLSSYTTPIGKQSAPILSKFQQYRRLRFDWKNNVHLARSKIQGLGLYAARDIEKHEFIIEYLGQLIRNEVGNRRERLYNYQKRGIYMFRADDDCIVDATLYGGLARYINHSCEPNCIAESFTFESQKRIVIIAKRFLKKGEELTYDYKFDYEEDKPNRIPCLCGALFCKKWMN